MHLPETDSLKLTQNGAEKTNFLHVYSENEKLQHSSNLWSLSLSIWYCKIKV